MITIETIETLQLLNARGQLREVRIKLNRHGRFTWRVVYPQQPTVEHAHTYNYFDTAQAARRSARRHLKNLAQ
jgi:hypothetical protein